MGAAGVQQGRFVEVQGHCDCAVRLSRRKQGHRKCAKVDEIMHSPCKAGSHAGSRPTRSRKGHHYCSRFAHWT